MKENPYDPFVHEDCWWSHKREYEAWNEGYLACFRKIERKAVRQHRSVSWIREMWDENE